MPNFETILRNFSGAVCRDQRAAKLLRILEAHYHDGTELHGVIDHALPGLENETAATRIKRAAKRNITAPFDSIVIELVAGLLDEGARLRERRSCISR
jgi:hypothetical protein